MHQDPYKFPSQIQATKLEVVTNKEKKKKSSKAVGNGEITNFKKDSLLPDAKYSIAIVTGFFTQQTNIKDKVGMKVLLLSTKEEGKVIGPFGKAGKCKVNFVNGISDKSIGEKVQLFQE